MQFAQRFDDLPEYAFPRLRRLIASVEPGEAPLAMSIGEPRHPLSPLVAETIAAHAHEFGRYPPNEGAPELREAIVGWLRRRYGVALDPETQVTALNGTREGLFNAGLALCPEVKGGRRPAVLMPNPFYQCYGAAALAAGAEPVAVPAVAAGGFLPDYAALPPALLDRVGLAYICSPANPQGAVADAGYWRELLALAERHDFLVLADECYSEICRDEEPPGVLAAVAETGADPERAVAFHSLSKRSSAPGLRAGFAAGGPRAIEALKRLRAYGGAPVPLPLQRAATALWGDEAHVEASRALYAAKFEIADRLLGHLPGYLSPQAGFFLWLGTPDGEATARALWRRHGVLVLPGAYLGRNTAGAYLGRETAGDTLGRDTAGGNPGRDTAGGNPGRGYIRVALVAEPHEIERGLSAIAEVLGETAAQPTTRVS